MGNNIRGGILVPMQCESRVLLDCSRMKFRAGGVEAWAQTGSPLNGLRVASRNSACAWVLIPPRAHEKTTTRRALLGSICGAFAKLVLNHRNWIVVLGEKNHFGSFVRELWRPQTP